MGSAKLRQRYWARAMEAWSTFSRVQPNEGHRSIARLEAAGGMDHLITQVSWWTVDRGPWTVNRGPWTVDRGPSWFTNINGAGGPSTKQ